jgi:hypothetical protein
MPDFTGLPRRQFTIEERQKIRWWVNVGDWVWWVWKYGFTWVKYALGLPAIVTATVAAYVNGGHYIIEWIKTVAKAVGG